MSRSIFGWDLPPGCTHKMIDEQFGQEGPCEICGKSTDLCICPECTVCESQGEVKCYKEHGLKLSREQMVSRSEARMSFLQDLVADEGMYHDYLVDGGAFDDDGTLIDTSNPWRQV